MRIHSEKTEAAANRGGVSLFRVAAVVLALASGLAIARSLTSASPQNQPDLGASGPHYLDPTSLKLSPGGKQLYVVCAASNLVLVVDTHTRRVVGRFSTGAGPSGIATSPDGKFIYVSNELGNSVNEFAAGTLRITRTFKAGWGPVGITTDQARKFLYTANTLGDDISVIDLSTGKEIKRLAAGHFPEYVDLSRDGKWIYVSNILAKLASPEQEPDSQLTVVDTARQIVASRITIPGAVQLRHIAQLPAQEGGYLLIPFQQPHNLIPLVQIQQGWYLTNGMAIIGHPQAGRASEVKEVLLDDIDRFFADGFGAASTPDGQMALVTASGANVVSIIDVAKLNRLLKQAALDGHEDLAHRLDSARQFVVKRLPTGGNPVDVVVSPDSHFAYIANRTDDTVSVIDLQHLKVASTIDLGGPKEITALRHGEQLFYDARFCYQSQLACASCHPHNGFEDGLVWSLETPELGHDIVENRTLLGIAETSPFKWNGLNPDLATQDGARTAMYIFRSQGFSPAEVKDLVAYIQSLKLPPNPRRPAGGRLTEAQERGRAIFFRTTTNDGRIIPDHDRCYYCHAPQTHYTSRVRMDVGTSTNFDNVKDFDIPQLEGVYMRAPYLHDGKALTLEGIWTRFNPDDKHGITSDMNKVQLNDLIEFLKTL